MKQRLTRISLLAGVGGAALIGLFCLLPRAGFAGAQGEIKMEQAKELFSEQKYGEALALLSQVTAEEPENGEAYHYAGLCQMGLGKPAEALALFEKAQSLSPMEPGLQEDMAWASLELKKYDQAITLADGVLAKDPNRQRALYYKGLALFAQKKYEEALPLFQKLSGVGEFAQAGYYYSAVCLVNLGRVDEAQASFEKAAATGPTTPLGQEAAKYASALKGGEGGQKAKPYNLRVRLLYQYDTNILPVHSEDSLPEDVTNKEDGRMVVDLDARYNFVDTQSTTVGVRYLGYGSWHSRESKVNLMYNLGEFNGYYRFNAGKTPMRLGLVADYSAASLDNQAYSSNWTVNPEFSIQWSGALRTRVIVESGGEAFDEPGEKENNRDNNRVHVSLYQHFIFQQGKVNTWLGYRWGQVSAAGENYNRTDNGALVGIVALFPKNVQLAVVGRFESRDYPDNAIDRKENLTAVNTSLQVPLYKGISAYLSVIYQQVDSNVSKGLGDYDRWIYTGGVLVEI